MELKFAFVFLYKHKPVDSKEIDENFIVSKKYFSSDIQFIYDRFKWESQKFFNDTCLVGPWVRSIRINSFRQALILINLFLTNQP